MRSDQNFGETLHRLFHAYKRALREAYRETDIPLTVSHMRALEGVHAIANCTARELADRSGRDKGQITRLLAELCGEGLIEKRPHPEDGRRQLLALTPRGEGMIVEIRRIEAKAATVMARGLARDEIETFVRLATRMTENLSE